MICSFRLTTLGTIVRVGGRPSIWDLAHPTLIHPEYLSCTIFLPILVCYFKNNKKNFLTTTCCIRETNSLTWRTRLPVNWPRLPLQFYLLPFSAFSFTLQQWWSSCGLKIHPSSHLLAFAHSVFSAWNIILPLQLDKLLHHLRSRYQSVIRLIYSSLQ